MIVWPQLQYERVGLRRLALAYLHGMPDSDHCCVAKRQDQSSAQAGGHTGVLRSNWRRMEYFSFDQLNMIVAGQHARGHHLLVAIDRDSHPRG